MKFTSALSPRGGRKDEGSIFNYVSSDRQTDRRTGQGDVAIGHPLSLIRSDSDTLISNMAAGRGRATQIQLITDKADMCSAARPAARLCKS